MEIKKIRLGELENFIESKSFAEFKTIPITPDRAKSYLNNPHAKSTDVVLYMGFIEEKMVAFRTLFADSVRSEKKQIRFAWCSGNWVHPDFRRLGFSEELLAAAYSDWDKKLMFTNYAPNSEQLYLKTGWFSAVHQFEGIRGYLSPKTKKLVSFANKNRFTKIIFSILDFFINIFSSILKLFYFENAKKDFRFEVLEAPDEECFALLDNHFSSFLFNRGRKELEWIFQYPWISKTNLSLIEKYPFSSFSNSFKYQTVKIFEQNKFIGFFIFSVHGGHLKTLFFNGTEKAEHEIAGFLKTYSCGNNIEIITIYHLPVAEQFFKRKFPFLHLKKYGQKIYSSFEINNLKKLHFQDGDGDVMFT